MKLNKTVCVAAFTTAIALPAYTVQAGKTMPPPLQDALRELGFILPRD